MKRRPIGEIQKGLEDVNEKVEQNSGTSTLNHDEPRPDNGQESVLGNRSSSSSSSSSSRYTSQGSKRTKRRDTEDEDEYFEFCADLEAFEYVSSRFEQMEDANFFNDFDDDFDPSDV